MNTQTSRIYLLFLLVFTACRTEDKELVSTEKSPLFNLLSPSLTGIDFENTLTETEKNNIITYEYIYNGGGVAIGDVNNDGFPDIYLSGNQVKNKLFLNKGGLKFEDITTKIQLEEKEGWKTGAAMADINGDGLIDIYLCYSGNAPQEGMTAPLINDYKPRSNQLFINQGLDKNGLPTFKEQAKEYGVDAIGTFSTQAYFLDYDLDGDLDLFLLNHANKFYNIFFNVTMLRSKRHPYYGNQLYENQGDKFVEVSEKAGIDGTGINFGLSAAISDLNKDGYPDIFVTNDYSEQDFCYLNNGDGTFTETSKASFAHFSKYSMGSDVADINNDLNPDLFVVDMLPEDNYRQKVLKGPDEYNKTQRLIDSGYHKQYMRNNLHLNKGLDPEGNLRFTEVGQLAGISNTDWSWAPLFADYDNDGFKDVIISNGYLRDYSNLDFNNYTVHEAYARAQSTGEKLDLGLLISKIPSTKVSNYIYKNVDGLLFEDKTEDWGLKLKTVSNAMAYADFDNDGDLDLIINNLNDPILFYENLENEQFSNNFLSLTLRGEGKNTQALGTKVILNFADGSHIYQEAYYIRGFQSSVEPKMNIGLGRSRSLESLDVIWPSKKLSHIENVQINQLLSLNEADATDIYQYDTISSDGFFKDITATSNIDFAHKENAYVDFNYESLIPYQVSKTGGKVAVGDVNNDGNDDIFFLGARGQASKLYLGLENGKFKDFNANQPWGSAEDIVHEDYDALFFDADGDGDLDLYVVSGGNEEFNGDNYYQDRLYLNKGNGIFSKNENALPDMKFSGGVVKAADYDKDGDLDLFVGGRISGGNYPMPPRSTLLKNESTETTVKFSVNRSYDLEQVGMVTDAEWIDLDGDTWPDLVLTGEWMPVSIFKNNRGVLKNQTEEAGLQNSNGWWFSLEAGDFDNDGDIDFLAGNLGENTQFRASVTEPMRYYIQDIDNNGRIDPILTYYIDGVSYPWPTRDELMAQVSSLKKQYVSYDSYAKTNTDQFLKTNNIEPRFTLEIYTLASSFIENNGDGTFSVKSLPKPIQDSAIQDFVYSDFDGDGNAEILTAGNLFPFRVSQGALDASFGAFLKFNKNNFGLMPQSDKLWLDGDIKSLHILKHKSGKKQLLVSRNNDRPSLYNY